MHSITDDLIGVIASQKYRVEVWKTSAPKKVVSNEWWVYITKISHNGEIGERSIGLPESDLPELIILLDEICGKDKVIEGLHGGNQGYNNGG